MRTITLGDNLPVVSCEAMGRLCTWALPTEEEGYGFDQVSIYREGKGNDLIAYYSDSKSERKYVIGAIWRADEEVYSYHS